MKKTLPKMVKATSAVQSSLLTSFIKVEKREISKKVSSPTTGTESTSKSIPEEKKIPVNKRQSKANSKASLY